MAYVSTVTTERDIVLDGKKYTQYKIVETDIGLTSEWSVGCPTAAVITLVEADLTTPGSAATIQPEFGVVPTWVNGGDGHVGEEAVAAATVRIGTDRRVVERDGLLYGRSRPNIATGVTGVITTYLTLCWGH